MPSLTLNLPRWFAIGRIPLVSLGPTLSIGMAGGHGFRDLLRAPRPSRLALPRLLCHQFVRKHPLGSLLFVLWTGLLLCLPNLCLLVASSNVFNRAKKSMEIWSKFGPLIIFENSKPCGTSILNRPSSPQCSVALPKTLKVFFTLVSLWSVVSLALLSKMLAYFKSAKTAVLGSIRRSLFPWRRFLRFNESRSGLLLLSTFASPFCQIPPSLTPPPSSSKLWLLLPASQWLTSLVPAGRNKTNKAFLSLWPSCVSSLMLPPNSFLSVDLKVSSSLESIQKILLLKNLFGFPAMLPSLTKLITVGSVLFKSNDNSLLFIVLEKLETLLASCVVRMILKLIIAFVR